jgi:hypothetical protein
LIPPFPTLETVTPPDNQTGALLEDVLTLTGHHLGGDSVTLRFSHPLLDDPIEIPLNPGDWTETEITVQLPNEPANWPAGFYKVAAFISKAGEQDRTTNEIPFMLMPQVDFPIQFAPVSSPVGFQATVTCIPEVRPDQGVSLLLGDRAFPADSHPTQTDELTFLLTDVSSGDEYFVRLRIDGVDSPLIDRSEEPPVFDEDYKVTIP